MFRALTATLLLAAGPACAELVDFNDLPDGTVVTNQYAGVTFSSEAGQSIVTTGNFICTGNPGINCTQDVYIDFASPVSDIALIAVEPNEFGTVATFFLYSGATLLGTQDLEGLATTPGTFGIGSIVVSLFNFDHVTRIEIRGPAGLGDLDNGYGGAGIGWDEIGYTVDAVPEPGTAALMLLGALGMAAAAHRRRR